MTRSSLREFHISQIYCINDRMQNDQTACEIYRHIFSAPENNNIKIKSKYTGLPCLPPDQDMAMKGEQK